MCFSATASFVAAGGLSVVYLLSRHAARNTPYTALATVPVFFALQQYSEGTIWLSQLTHVPSALTTAAIYTFLAIAMCVWPFWIPFSLWRGEENSIHRKILAGLTIAGMLYGSAAAWYIFQHGASASHQTCHIYYNFGNLPRSYGSLLAYAILTIIPLFLSTIPGISIFRWTVLLSFLVTLTYYTHYLVSVWCFFGAIVSVAIYWVIRYAKKTHNPYLR